MLISKKALLSVVSSLGLLALQGPAIAADKGPQPIHVGKLGTTVLVVRGNRFLEVGKVDGKLTWVTDQGAANGGYRAIFDHLKSLGVDVVESSAVEAAAAPSQESKDANNDGEYGRQAAAASGSGPDTGSQPDLEEQMKNVPPAMRAQIMAQMQGFAKNTVAAGAKAKAAPRSFSEDDRVLTDYETKDANIMTNGAAVGAGSKANDIAAGQCQQIGNFFSKKFMDPIATRGSDKAENFYKAMDKVKAEHIIVVDAGSWVKTAQKDDKQTHVSTSFRITVYDKNGKPSKLETSAVGKSDPIDLGKLTLNTVLAGKKAAFKRAEEDLDKMVLKD